MNARVDAAAKPVLDVADLHVEFATHGGIVKAVRGASFAVAAGKTLAIVGESGCGKSVTVQSVMGLIPMPPGRITRGTALFAGVDILRRKIVDGDDVRGNRIGMIFQDPMSSLNPTMRVGEQRAPIRRRRLRAKPEEGKPRRLDDDRSRLQRRHDDHRVHRVRQHMAQHDSQL